MGVLKTWPNEMKHEMRRWDRDREWLARRFMAGWICLLVSLVLMGLGLHKSSAAVAVAGIAMFWSVRGGGRC